MRHVLSATIVALVFGSLAGATVGAVAQEPAPVAPAAVDADTVDGRHAVGYTTKPRPRRGKLIAAGSDGYLPNNIIRKARNAGQLDGLDSTMFVQRSEIPSLVRLREEIVSKRVTTEADTLLTDAEVQCPSGTVRTGGGFRLDSSSLQGIGASRPAEPRGWHVSLDVARIGFSFEVFAVCLHLE